MPSAVEVCAMGCLGEPSSGQSQPVIASLLDLPEDAVVVNWLLAGSGADMLVFPFYYAGFHLCLLLFLILPGYFAL